MAKKVTPKAEKLEVVPEQEAPKFTACRQCSYPADCESRAKCRKGFK